MRHIATANGLERNLGSDSASKVCRWQQTNLGFTEYNINESLSDPGSGQCFTSCPDLGEEDVDAVVRSSQKAFEEYRLLNPRIRAELLLKWHHLIRESRDDIATILTYETGKPLSEAFGEIDYASGFTWWFAGEAERIRGDISTPAAPGRRVLVIKQPIGVCAALVPWNFPIA